LIGKNLKNRIVTKSIRVVDVLVASDDLVEALAKQRQHGMTNPFLFARITDELCQPASESMPLIQGPQRKQTGVRTDLSTGKISSNRSVSVEGKGQLWYTTRCHLWDAPKENAGFAKTQCSSLLLEHPFLFSPVKS
jgi:hypothetical protein